MLKFSNKSVTVFTFIILSIILIIGFYLKSKKTAFYSNGGFDRKYNKSIKISLVQNLPLIHKFTNFIQSSNKTYVIAEGEGNLFKITFNNNQANSGILIQKLNQFQIFSNTKYYVDDTLNRIYSLNDRNRHLNVHNFSLNENSTILNSSTLDYFKYEPINIYNGRVISAKHSLRDLEFEFVNPLSDNFKCTTTFTKLVDQGNISYLANRKEFLYVSLFSNSILKFNKKFELIAQGKTIDTISQKPKVKLVDGKIMFSSPPRISNYDYFILGEKIFVRSTVKSNLDLDFKKKIVFDVYDLNDNFFYTGSVSIKNLHEDYPSDIHLLNNNILLLLYENNITAYKIEI